MYDFTYISSTTATISGIYWSIFTYSAMFNSSDSLNKTQSFRFGPQNDFTFYNYYHPAIEMDCPYSGKLLDCVCDCNSGMFGVSFSTSYCFCHFNETVKNSIECKVQVDCAFPGYAPNSYMYSLDSRQVSWTPDSQLDLESTSVSCFQKPQQYMYSCAYNVLIGAVDYNWTGNQRIFSHICLFKFFS